MENKLSHPSRPLWLPDAKKLIDHIDALHSPAEPTRRTSLDDDLQKLHTVGLKLNHFIQSVSRGTISDSRLVRHELRNLISATIGYSEFILEEMEPIADMALYNPLRKIVHLCHQLSNHDSHEEALSYAASPVPNTLGGTILIVDDQMESRDILKRYLQLNNAIVLEANTGTSMFSVLAEKEVDLILLDLILPEMDGDELLELLKQDEKLRAIPVIVVSGNKETDRVIRCIEAGAEDYLFKPFNPVLLQARIRAGVERKRWHNKELQYRKELERNQHFIRSVFGRYLSEDIVTRILENPEGLDLGGSQRKVTVLMADISGFSSIAEQLPPQRVVRLLNNYLGVMSDVVMQYGGTVDEFIGDAILAIFGAPTSNEDDSDRAVQAAIAMQKAMILINRQNREDQLPEIAMGVSVNTGLVVAGNIGSEKRAKYGIVGHTVNQTSRIGSHCEAGEILISEATHNDCQSSLVTGPAQSIQAKGILKAIKVYKLEKISAPTAQNSRTEASKPNVIG
ncbi:MAG: adenylate/guanylate cyclase domain-containing protein [Oceanicoccus sp.]